MASCDYCNSTILFGGVRQGDLRFCNQKCFHNGYLLSASRQMPSDLVRQQLEQLHRGTCPKCQGPGPVDVHTSYQVVSLLVLTRWSSMPLVSCRACGVKSQVGNMLLSLVAGWWGFPWGLIFTPVQVTRNIVGLCQAPDPTRPSAQLEKLVRLHLASQIVSQTPAGPR